MVYQCMGNMKQIRYPIISVYAWCQIFPPCFRPNEARVQQQYPRLLRLDNLANRNQIEWSKDILDIQIHNNIEMILNKNGLEFREFNR
jgi:hypothetical protein